MCLKPTTTATATGYISFACSCNDHEHCTEPDCVCDCHATLPTPPAPKPETPRRTCGWAVPSSLAASILRAGGGALFAITHPDRRGRMVTTDYALQAIRDRGRFAGWKVTKLAPDGSLLEEYAIDPSFGADPRHWDCSCGDSTFRRAKDVGHVCKHAKAIAALLGSIGINPQTGA